MKSMYEYVGMFLLAADADQKVRQRITALKIRIAQIQEVTPPTCLIKNI